MNAKIDLVNTLRAIYNRFWTHPEKLEKCVDEQLVQMTVSGPELTAKGLRVLSEADNRLVQ